MIGAGADHLRPRRMLGPPERVGDRARPLAAGVPAEELRDLHHLLGTAAAHPGHRLRGVPGVVAPEDLEHTHRILERRVGARQAPRPVRAGLTHVLPGPGPEVVAARRGVEAREQSGIVIAPVLIGDERRGVRVVDDVLFEVALSLQDVPDDAAEERDVRSRADLDEHVGDRRRARVARVDVNHHAPPLLGQHRPVKADRMRLRHVRAHDEHAIAVDEVARVIRRGAEAERGAQTGHGGAVSETGLVLDGKNTQAPGEELLEQVVLLVVERRPA